MELRNTNILMQECKFENGYLYSLIVTDENGFRHYQYYDADNETPESLIEGFKKQLGVDEIIYIPNNSIEAFTSTSSLEKSAVLRNDASYTLMKQLTEIEKLNYVELKHIAGKDYKVFYYPKYLIYEINSMAVKMPKQVLYDSGEIKWTFEYLIYPNFEVNSVLLQELRVMTGKELPINIEGVKLNVANRGFFRPFSPLFFALAYKEYFRQCGLSKGITNAIRVMEHDKIAQDSIFDIYQKFRQGKRDTVSFSGYEFYGPIHEMTLNEYIEANGMTKLDLGVLAQNAEKSSEFSEKYQNDPLKQPLIAYIENLNNSPFEAMDNYKEMEWYRCYIRKILYQMNMCWYDDFNQVITYINTVQPSAEIDPEIALMLGKVMWVQGKHGWGVVRKEHKPRRRSK